MLQTFKNGQTSVVLRAKLLDSSSTTGAGLTGLTSGSASLIISTIADNEATATAYTQAGSTIETITTLGTYAAPTATKCRFKEVDATNHKGVYEFQFADARFAVSSAKSLLVSVLGATNLQQADFLIQLQTFDPFVAALTAAQIATGVWTDTTAGDFTTALSVGKSVMNGVSLGTGLSVASVSGAVGSVNGLTASDVAAIKTQTDKLTFDGANHIVADTRKIATSATAATNLESGALALVPSTCAAGSTTTSIVTNLTEATDTHYNGRVITFTSGALLGQASSITNYNGTTKTLTVTALTESPANTDGFVIS